MTTYKNPIIARRQTKKSTFASKAVLNLTSIIWLLIIFYGNTGIAQKSKSREFNSIDELETMIKSPSWEDRLFAAQNFFSIPQIDTMKATEILVDGIVLEAAQPSSLEFPPRSYLNNSERIIRKLIFNLVDLGPSIFDTLDSYVDDLSGESRAWILIVFGLLKDPSAHQEIREILLKHPNPNLRSMAGRALYEYADTADIAALKEALTDDYNLTISSCTSVSGDLYEIVYPVRQEAASALRRMGYYVVFEGAKTTLKEPGEWHEDQP
jgi:hypothetical protein